MAQLVAEEMGFGQGWNSPSHTNITRQNSSLTLFSGVRIDSQRHDHRPQRRESLRERHLLGETQSSREKSTSGQTHGTCATAFTFQVSLNHL